MDAFILALVVIGVLWWLFGRRRLPFGRLGNSHRGRQALNAIPPRLMRKLDRLTRDRRVSERLIERIAFNHPERPKSWCVEKAIYDLQRDRRS
ncbi:MAG: hypothetical protein AAGE59_04345 [Cyanobacteria bacterium P01_F01_bin.86]